MPITPDEDGIAVVIAAYRAEATVAAAIRSALAEPEVVEVVLVDDDSPDKTASAALSADDGTGRLTVVRMPKNGGPAVARNRAIAISSAPWIAVLDADDIILPGRFAHLMSMAPFDLAADNVMFFQDGARLPIFLPQARAERVLHAEAFVAGNLSRRDRPRGELGFLKPVLSRAFLEAHALRYNEAMWLGEDYDLVLRMLLSGAVFRVSHQPGYGARVRHGSLSAVHRTADLWTQVREERALIKSFNPNPSVRSAMLARVRQVEGKAALRSAIDLRRANGYVGALRYIFSRPAQAWPILSGVLRDKVIRRRESPRRYLLPLDPL